VALNLNVPRVSVPQGGKMRLLWIAGASLLVLLVGYNSCTTYVKPGEAGVKQIKFGIADFGIIEHVIAVLVMANLLPQRLNSRFD